MTDQAVNPKPAVADAKSAGAAASNATKILGAYKQLLTYQFSGTLLLVVTLTIVLLIAYSRANVELDLLPLVMLAGVLGAFFSALTRLYNVDQASVALISPTVQALGGRYLFMYSFVPPIVGAIAAVILYLMFAGKIVSGGIFPDLSCPSHKDCDSLKNVMANLSPAKPEDYPRALVWGFIAGFSERFVPNILGALAERESAKQAKKDSA